MEQAREEAGACLAPGGLADGFREFVRRDWAARFGLAGVG